MEGCKPTMTTYEGQIVCDDCFLNHVHNAKYWFTPMNKGVSDVAVRLKQVVLSNITMLKIDMKEHTTKTMQQQDR